MSQTTCWTAEQVGLSLHSGSSDGEQTSSHGFTLFNVEH